MKKIESENEGKDISLVYKKATLPKNMCSVVTRVHTSSLYVCMKCICYCMHETTNTQYTYEMHM